MSKQTFVCPNCNNSSTFTVESSVSRHSNRTNINYYHQIIRCDVCEELTYKVIKQEIIYRGGYSPPEIKTEEVFQYPFGHLELEQDLPKLIKGFYSEAYNCYRTGSLKAAAAMCRATISAICDDKRSAGRDLKERINNLPLSQRLKEVSKNIKWIGDKTLHNKVDWTKVNWNKKTIEEVLGFISRIVDDLYTQERKAGELNQIVSEAGKKVSGK